MLMKGGVDIGHSHSPSLPHNVTSFIIMLMKGGVDIGHSHSPSLPHNVNLFRAPYLELKHLKSLRRMHRTAKK